MPSVKEIPKKYFLEKDRIASFKTWPFNERQKCNIKMMAEAGFYWCGSTREPDIVACFICGKILDGWEPQDDPWTEHRQHAPQCAFVKIGRSENQLTIGEQLDLMDVYVQKHCEQFVEKMAKMVTEKGNEVRENLKITYKNRH